MFDLRQALLLLTIATAIATSAGCSDDAESRRESAATLAVATATAAATPATPADPDCDTDSGAAGAFCADTSGMEAAAVVRIIDGDTLDVTLDGHEERIRIFGIDTPERGDRCFAEASALLEALADGEIRLQTDARKVDRNGRLLRYVYRPDGVSIDAVMITAGAAHAWTRDGALRDALVALEERARLQRVGCLWG